MVTNILQQLEEKLGTGRVKANVILAPYTTFKVGGPAEFYFQAHTQDDLLNAIKAAHELKIPLHLLGGVSNVMIDDKGLKGLSVRNMYQLKEVIEETDDEVFLKVGSGYNMTRLAQETAEAGYEGFEYHFGLPGTLGGGIFMNSKWTAHPPTHYIGDDLVRAAVANHAGDVREEPHEYFQFAYDYSILQDTREFVIWALFKMKKNDPKILLQRNKDATEYRKKTQPFGVATSGCFFQNVEGQSAGQIIDELGLKGLKVGGVHVSEIHANFIINDGTGTVQDVQKLVETIKSIVKEKRNIDLKAEVIIVEDYI